MAENDLVRLRPRDVAKVWGTALGQLIELWRAAMMALMELESGEQAIPGSEQPIPSGQSNQFSAPSADGRMPQLTAQNLVGETFHQQLDGRAVVFTQAGSGPGTVTVECCVNEADEAYQPIEGDTYRGQVVNHDGAVVATVGLDAGS
jgi:hypothetical protein